MKDSPQETATHSTDILHDRDILCFAGGYWDYAGFQQHTMRHLAERNRVLFINPIGSRKATFNPANWRHYTAKVFNMFAQQEARTETIPVCNPHVIPLVYNPLAQRINRRLVKRQVGGMLREKGFHDYLLWIGTPTAVFVLDVFDPVLTIYNPVDRWSDFSFVHKEKMLAYEREVARRSDLILCTADAIRDDLLPYNPETHVVSHAVDFDHFHSALDRETTPEDIARIPAPIIGFFGGLHEWVDLKLIRRVATQYPEAHVVLIGSTSEDLGALVRLENVHLLGGRPFASIPDYLRRFDVCLIPFVVNDLMKAVDPTKLREYLAQGKPVVSTNLPEVRKLADLVYIAETHEAFVDLVGKALAENDPALRRRRIETARESAWPRKLEEISALIFHALARKASARAT